MATNVKTSSKHPKGFWFVSLLQIFERFSYYGMRGLLILFLAKDISAGGLGLGVAKASSIYATFTMMVYFAPLVGGIIADTYLGMRKTFFIGSLFIAGGLIAMFAGATSKFMVYAALVAIIIGNGLWKPNITAIVGEFYDDSDPHKDGAFSIFYTFINIGAFFAPIVCGTLSDKTFATINEGGQVVTYGYKYGFLAAGIGMLMGSVVYMLFANKVLGEIGTSCKKANAKKASAPKEALTSGDWKRVGAIMGLSLFVIIFWAGFEQAGSSMTLYANDFINRDVGGFVVPTSWFQSINPFLCVVLGPTFALWFLKLAKRPKGDIPTARKMAYGLIILAAGFGLMALAAMQRGNSTDPAIKANILFLFGAYTLHTVGEMFLSPVGLSMVSKLAPKQIVAVMMGAWYFATGFGNYIAGVSAAFVEKWGGLQVFSLVTAVAFASGLLLLALSPIFQRVIDSADEELKLAASKKVV